MKKNYKDLQEFIGALDAAGELKRISEPVSPEIEISKITDAESKKPGGGKALFFENVIDNGKKSFPIATNLFGSNRRMAMALGVENLDSAGNEIDELINMAPPQNLTELIKAAQKVLPISRIAPKKFRGKPPCQEVVQTGGDIDLSEIPVLKCWPRDGGRFVTLPLVFTKSPDGKKRNLGMYRLQIYDKRTTGMHWHIHKDGSHYFKEHAALNKRMEVAVAIGADPATIYAATAPMPRGVDELLLAGFFRKKGVPMADCITVNQQVPADAEFVLEGYVDCDERRMEGPFGDHTGYYSLADMYPVFHLTAITRKKNPVYCATLVGPPPMEDCYMAKATERIFLPLLKAVMPEIRDYFLPWEGVFHNAAIVSINKEYPAHAQKLASGLWGQGQMSFCKSIVVIDADKDPSNLPQVWKLFVENFDPTTDIISGYGVLDVLDHSSPNPFMGSKIAFDLTGRISGEPPRCASKFEDIKEQDFEKLNAAISKIDPNAKSNFGDKFCAISIEKNGRRGADILKALESESLFKRHFRAVAIFDAGIDVNNRSKLLWKIFNNTDPLRDIKVCGQTCFIDACKKNKADGHEREWPDDLDFNK